MLADPASATLPALVPLAVVVAEDVPVTVPRLFCTSTYDVAAAAAIVVAAGTRASAAPATEAASEMLRQTVNQILLLPGLRQLKAGAQLLQLGDGLRACGQTNQT
jgi:sulfite reductase beta subunit-like hemoprotein